MVKAKLIALLLLTATVAVAQKSVNHLVYSFTTIEESKKGTEKKPGMGAEIKVNDKQVVITRLKEDGTFHDPYGYRIYDRENNLIIYDFAKQEQYVIEQADSVVRRPTIAKATSKTATINGYTCKAYEATADWYVMGFNAGTYSYIFWVTEDILTDEAINNQIVPAFTSNIATFSFKGTLVKVDVTYTRGSKSAKMYYELVKANNTEDAAKPVTMPWKKEGYKAWLPLSGDIKDVQGTTYTRAGSYTSETPQQLRDRLRALLTKVTGIEKPKFSEVKMTGFTY